MTTIADRGARASLFHDAMTNDPHRTVVSGVRDYSLFDHVHSSRAASDYSRSSSAKRVDRYRTALYVLAIVCL